MNRDDRTFALLGLAAVGWYLYTSSKGLTIAGQPANSALTPAQLAAFNLARSNVQPSGTTSVAATNVFSAIGSALSGIVGAIVKKGPGNTPQTAPATNVGANVNGIPGQVPGVTITDPNIVADTPSPYLSYTDPTNAIYWPSLDPSTQPDAYTASASPSLNVSPGVPSLGWTLDPSLVI